MSQAVGIDLGTTYSLVAYMGDTGLRVCTTAAGQRSTPSVVLVAPEGTVVGDEAKRSAAVYPDRTFGFFKRDMGAEDAVRSVDGASWSPIRLSAAVLDSLAEDARRATGVRPSGAVVTVPAYFGDAARRATVEAAELTGLTVHELIHEPTAAALAFGFGGRGAAGETVLVYDLGGGTFDVSVVRIEGDTMKVVATDGDHELGGKDWDDMLMAEVATAFVDRHGIDPRMDPISAADLRERCEDAKRGLSRLPEVTVSVTAEGIVDRIAITRSDFESATSSLLGRTETLLGYVLADASLGWADVTATLLVGGSTRMPACARLVARLAGKPPQRGVDPDLAVVHGAAMLAASYDRPDVPAAATRRGSIGELPAIHDVIAHALGFVVINEAGDHYVNEVMIPRNSQIPRSVVRSKRLDKGIENLDVYLLQGHAERPLATESLGRYRFSAVPDARRHRDVDIAFTYDRDGIVRISASVGGRALADADRDLDDNDLSWTDEDPRDHARSSLAAVLLIDCSASMAGAKLAEAKASCADFAHILGEIPGARVGLVSFASGSRIESALAEQGDPVAAAATALSLYGSTDLQAGLDTAARLFQGTDGGQRVIIVLTDGAPNSRGDAQASARACVAAGIDIATVGVTGADQAFLASISTADRDVIFTDAAGLRGAVRSIARSLAGGLTRMA